MEKSAAKRLNEIDKDFFLLGFFQLAELVDKIRR
jgi:hypothetical protein